MSVLNLSTATLASSDRTDVDLVARAKALVPDLREARSEIDRLARPPEELAERMKQEGIYSMTVPHEYGGLQSSLDTWRQVVTEIGRGDAGVAWGLTLVTACNWMAANLYPKHVSEEIFARPNTNVAGVFSGRAVKARRADGGIVVEKGMWFFNSGVYQADWDLLGVPMFDKNGEPIGPGVAAVPMSDVKNLHDWNPSGLRGSGSTNVAMEDVFIPDERIVSLMGCNRGEVKPTYPEVPIFNAAFGPLMVLILAFPVLGVAKHIMENFLETVGKRDIKLTTYTNQGEAPVTHLQTGEISAMFDAAESIIVRAVEKVDLWSAGKAFMPVAERARVNRDVAFADRMVFEAATKLSEAGGGSFAHSKNIANRLWQDARVATMHPFVNPSSNFETYGRLLCGVEELLMQV
ncbi:acyl-CoA dehydrogenase family protein [Novosphingobium terrae]|uniref:acyl-CoA dehydrogenase family protein n=1 Tax=Novosphingobium terrae TaxID=2726189 RepID=UPI00197FAFBF|nr:acyl-CoA dehydrogenase family protein [Novosphingobium terrae]